MSTQFDDSFQSGDVIQPEHIKQLFPAVNNLETGKSFFRNDESYIPNIFKLNFSGGANQNSNKISSYERGLLVTFVANKANSGSMGLEIQGPNGSLGVKSLVKPGNVPLVAGDIKLKQIVAAIYNDTGSGYFEMIGSPTSSSGGSTGPALSSNSALFFGDGSDGDVTISSTSYEELFEHKFYNNLTIESGGRLRTRGHKVYVKNQLILDGEIEYEGRHAIDSSGTDGGWPGADGNDQVNWPLASGEWAGLGEGQSHFGRDAEAAVYCARGGNGGSGLSGAGGEGDSGVWGVAYAPERVYNSLPAALSGLSDGGLVRLNNDTRCVATLRGGMGGASGAGDGNSAAGGSGGSGGGVVWVAARTLAGSGSLRVPGGNGGAGGGPDAGGGGGGGAGVIFLLSADSSHSFSSDISGGNGGASGGGTGTDGASGDGGFFIFKGDL